MDPEDLEAGGDRGRMHGEASDHGRVYQAGRDQYVAEQDLHLHFVDGLRQVRRTTPSTGSGSEECPYPGLAAFAGEHAPWFFGRDTVVAELLVRLDEQVCSGGPLVVVAASGAGKSSLLRAGLLPAVGRGALPVAGAAQWPRLVLTPTARPVPALAGRLAEATGVDARRFVEAAAHGPQVCAQVLHEVLRAGGRRLVVVVDQTEELFTECEDLRQRRDFLALLAGHVSAVFTVRFSPDGRTLATAGSDEHVRLWHVADPKRPRPAGPPLTRHSGAVWAVAFSPDGGTLATAGNDQSVRLWNTADPDRPGPIGAPLTSHSSAARALAFSPNGHALATGGENGTVLLWEMRTDRAVRHICASTKGSPTQGQWQRYVPGAGYRPPCR
ncbi:AAA family ATPase [Streptomyces sp. NPDC047315]|uniref:WD40 repeat domain-containing protein n=1 Tax=Streptomyces sp. NPDC047315 TaxID=3155142 RepID=UPI0033CFCBC6